MEVLQPKLFQNLPRRKISTNNSRMSKRSNCSKKRLHRNQLQPKRAKRRRPKVYHNSRSLQLKRSLLRAMIFPSYHYLAKVFRFISPKSNTRRMMQSLISSSRQTKLRSQARRPRKEHQRWLNTNPTPQASLHLCRPPKVSKKKNKRIKMIQQAKIKETKPKAPRSHQLNQHLLLSTKNRKLCKCIRSLMSTSVKYLAISS